MDASFKGLHCALDVDVLFYQAADLLTGVLNSSVIAISEDASNLWKGVFRVLSNEVHRDMTWSDQLLHSA